MRISPGAKQKIQLILAAAILIAAVRAGYILYERHITRIEQARKRSTALNPDYYVVPKKLYPYDLKSARQLTQLPVWVKEGYRYAYYPYDLARHRTDFSHEAGMLLPLQRLAIKDIATDISPGSSDQRQVIAIFDQDGKFLAQWHQFGMPSGVAFSVNDEDLIYVFDSESDNVDNPGFEQGIRIGDALHGWVRYFILDQGGNPATEAALQEGLARYEIDVDGEPPWRR